MQCNAKQCNAMQSKAKQSKAMQYNAMQYNAILPRKCVEFVFSAGMIPSIRTVCFFPTFRHLIIHLKTYYLLTKRILHLFGLTALLLILPIEDCQILLCPLSQGIINLLFEVIVQLWTEGLTHKSNTNAFHRRLSVIEKKNLSIV